MSRISVILFSALLAFCTFFTFNSVSELPERVAIHFGSNGIGDAWTSREEYRFLVLLAIIGLPMSLVGVMGGLPRLTNGRGQVPNPEHWFAQERREVTEAFLIAHACWLGCFTVALVYGVHILILRANAAMPAVLNTNRLSTMLVLYLCGLVWWTAAFLRHFQKTVPDK